MNLRRLLTGSILWLAICLPAAAQWLNVPAKGIPRTKDGKPDLSAPAPRKPDGKPDLSGVWRATTGAKYALDLASDFKPGELPIQPWAEALTKYRMTHAGEHTSLRCLPHDVPMLDAGTGGDPFKIVQEPDLVVILYEKFTQFRQIFVDGRTLPKEPNPTWLGYSVGRWDGAVLVAGTAGFNSKTWLDQAGHPTTDALHITERFYRRDFGNLDLQLTIDDSKAYTKPWEVKLPWQLAVDDELQEYICNENEKDLKHMVGK